jgi:hypothetical protein
MQNNYKKLTLDVFTKKLGDGDYKEASGARRAVGKAQDLSNKEKDQARALIDKHFSSPRKTPSVAPKAAKAVAEKPKKVARKAIKGIKKDAIVRKVLAGQTAQITGLNLDDIRRDPEKAVQVGFAAIHAAAQAINAAAEYKKLFPNQDVTQILVAADTLKQALQLIQNAIGVPVDKVENPNGSTKTELTEEEKRELELIEKTRPSPLLGRSPATS